MVFNRARNVGLKVLTHMLAQDKYFLETIILCILVRKL